GGWDLALQFIPERLHLGRQFCSLPDVVLAQAAHGGDDLEFPVEGRMRCHRVGGDGSEVEQVQYISGRYVMSAPKSSASRRAVAVPGLVVTAVQEHLAAYSEAGAEGLVFPAPEGGYLRLENFRKRVWTPAVVQAGVAPLRLHDLRHTCASLAIAAGADVKVLQRMLGHASAALTLDRYGHLMPGQARSVADRLDEMARLARPVESAPVSPIRGLR
ncbi:MAG: site-specific integrase, partial [Actinomycetes bacterium]